MPDGAERIRALNLTLQDFDRPDLQYIIKIADSRIRSHLAGIYNVNDMDMLTTNDAVTAFLVALVILKLTGDRVAARKYAMQEARRTEDLIRAMMVIPENHRHRLTILQELYGQLFGVELHEDPEHPFTVCKMRVPPYLTLSSKSGLPQFKMVNQAVDAGWVHIDVWDALRMARENVAGIIYNRAMGMNLVTQTVARQLKVAAARLNIDLEVDRRKNMGKYLNMPKSEEEMPPCVRHCIEKMRKGENLGDQGRFFLASYLLAIGMDIDKIVEYYRNAPDFNENVTRSRLKHTATRGTQRGDDDTAHYSVTGCDKLEDGHLCFRSPSCGTITNPMQYGRKKEFP